MSILTALILLAPAQRARADVPREVRRGGFQVVTTSWLRMHDPAFIQRLAAVRMPGFVSPLQPFELKMAPPSSSVLKALNPNTLKYSQLVEAEPQYDKHNAAVDFGQVVQNSGAASYYEDFATKDGTLTVEQVGPGPFRVKRIATYLGVLPSGKLKEDASMGNEVTGLFKLPIKAGQAFRIEYGFNTMYLEPKTYTTTHKVDYGTPMTVSLAGDSIPAKGSLTVTKDLENVVVTPGRTLTFNLLVKLDGTLKSTKLWVEPNSNDLEKYRIHMGKLLPVTAESGKTTTLPITLDTDRNYDVSGPLHLTVMTPDKKLSLKYVLPVSVLNQWMVSDTLIATREIALMGNAGTHQQTTYRQFKMNTTGFWEYSATGWIDNDIFALMIDLPVKGHRYGVVDPKWAYAGSAWGQSEELGKAFDDIRGSTFTLDELLFVGQQVHVSKDYDGLVESHKKFKAEGKIDLNDARYQEDLKWLTKQIKG